MTSPTTCSFSLYFLSVFLSETPILLMATRNPGSTHQLQVGSFWLFLQFFPMILHEVLAPSKRWLVGNGISTLQPRKVGQHQPINPQQVPTRIHQQHHTTSPRPTTTNSPLGKLKLDHQKSVADSLVGPVFLFI